LTPAPPARVRLVADLACPWCYIAFARLRRLLHHGPVELTWHPFLLNPYLPREGIPRAHYLERKFGSLAQAQGAARRIALAGAQERIRFVFGAMTRQPNTAAAHALVLTAAGHGRLVEAATALFRAFFEEGADIGSDETLQYIAATIGLPPSAGLPMAERLAEVAAAHERAYALGINGVPVLVFGRDHLIAGAQPVEALEALLDLERYRELGTRKGVPA
jgi:predicted DsbA family dithiol-disulfide isomerase